MLYQDDAHSSPSNYGGVDNHILSSTSIRRDTVLSSDYTSLNSPSQRSKHTVPTNETKDIRGNYGDSFASQGTSSSNGTPGPTPTGDNAIEQDISESSVNPYSRLLPSATYYGPYGAHVNVSKTIDHRGINLYPNYTLWREHFENRSINHIIIGAELV